MVFEHIEKLKQDFTDKYVVVDEARPELRRFVGAPGMTAVCKHLAAECDVRLQREIGSLESTGKSWRLVGQVQRHWRRR